MLLVDVWRAEKITRNKQFSAAELARSRLPRRSGAKAGGPLIKPFANAPPAFAPLRRGKQARGYSVLPKANKSC